MSFILLQMTMLNHGKTLLRVLGSNHAVFNQLKNDINQITSLLCQSRLFSTDKQHYIKMSNIQDSEINKLILDINSDDLHIDKLVNYILRENILVPDPALQFDKLMRSKAFSVLRRGSHQWMVPRDFKVGKFTPKDKEMINANYDKLINETNMRNHEEDLKREFLEKPDDDKYFLHKMNIVGLYISQDLPDLRVPCDVANTLRTHLVANLGPYTSEEDSIIINFMKNKPGDCNDPFCQLSVILGRSRDGVTRRYNHLKNKSTTKGRFTYKENQIMLREVLKVDTEAHRKESSLFGREFWNSLGRKLNRSALIVRNRWNRCIAPSIIMYEEGVMDVDFLEILLDYCVENNIQYSKEANWNYISTLPQFHGLSAHYLSYLYGTKTGCTKKTNPHLQPAEVTSQVIQKYYHQRRRKIEVDVNIINSYLMLKS